MADRKEKIMAPLWLKYPNIPQGSIGWRMGYGESYAVKFYEWYDALNQDQKMEYNQKFPEPVCWSLSEYNLKRRQGFWIYNWKKAANYAYSRERMMREREAGQKRGVIFFWGHHDRKDGGEGSRTKRYQ